MSGSAYRVTTESPAQTDEIRLVKAAAQDRPTLIEVMQQDFVDGSPAL